MTRTLLNGHLHEVLTNVRRLRTRFARTAPQPWDSTTAAGELTVHLGHLALCLLRQHGADTSDLEDPHRPIADPGDELADVVLAGLSINVLADADPAEAAQDPPSTSNALEAFLRLVVAAGSLSEAALVEGDYRHQPTGVRPSLSETAVGAVAACEGLADQLGLDLASEFRSMVADADSFLDTWSDAP